MSTADRDDLVPIPGGRWSAWRTLAVRGAGFPVNLVLELATPTAASAIDAVLESSGQIDRGTILQLESVLSADLALAHQAVRRLAAAPLLREAVLWQNRKLLANAFDPLLRSPSSGNAVERKRVAAVARYVQRYCTKNETIGFFGPLGWGALTDEAIAWRVRAGDRLVRQRHVNLETWAIDALCDAIARRVDVRRWVAPRITPFVRLDRHSLHVPGTGAIPLDATQLALLRMCDGRRTAREIAAEAQRTSLVASEAEVTSSLEQAAAFGVVVWKLEVPMGPDAELDLRRILERIDDAPTRQEALGMIDEVTRARDEVAAAAGDVVALEAALQRLDETFSSTCSVAATRRPGETYASRTVVYEDCLRDVGVEIGRNVLDGIGPALSLALDSARWMSWEIAARYRAALETIHDALCAELATAAVPLPDLMQRFDVAHMQGTERPMIREVEAEAQRRWSELLRLDPGDRTCSRGAADLAVDVAAAFACPGMGWPGGYMSPDLMIVGDGSEGGGARPHVVLGEVHFYNTLAGAVIEQLHPRPAELRRAVERDHPGARLIPLGSRAMMSNRLSIQIVPSHAVRLHMSAEAPPLGPTVAVGDLVVRRSDRGLVLQSLDGRLEFDVMHLLGAYLEIECSDGLSFIPRLAHTPRVAIDTLVLSRERWRFAAADLPFLRTKSAIDTYVEYRRWARQHAMPRFLFMKIQTEPKPIFVDSDSSILVDMVARLARAALQKVGADVSIAVTEMLPNCDQTWLVDGTGARYAAELRVVAHERN